MRLQHILSICNIIDRYEWILPTVWALIYGMKEVFRIAEGRDKAERILPAQKVMTNERINKGIYQEDSDSKITDKRTHTSVGINPDWEGR